MGVEAAGGLFEFLGGVGLEEGAALAAGDLVGTEAATTAAGGGLADALANETGFAQQAGIDASAATAGAGGWGLGDMAQMGVTPGLTGWGVGGMEGGAALPGWGMADLKGALQIAGPAMAIGSGLYGMTQADAMRRQAMLAGKAGDPWGQSGGRGMADSQLQQLMTNPGQAAASDPSYGLRIQGAQRAMAPMGQDSGAMAVAGANASTDWLNQRMSALGGLAGAGVNPGQGAQLQMTGQAGANSLASQSLASIGYGVTQAGGGNNMGFTPEQMAFLRSMRGVV